jgi:hypothetical protein
MDSWNNAETFDLRFTFLPNPPVGLPTTLAKLEYDVVVLLMFAACQVLLLFCGVVGLLAWCLVGNEYGLLFGLSTKDKGDFSGEGGAYISESCESSEGHVNAENSWRTLSHWVRVVWRVVCKETRRALEVMAGVVVERLRRVLIK